MGSDESDEEEEEEDKAPLKVFYLKNWLFKVRAKEHLVMKVTLTSGLII